MSEAQRKLAHCRHRVAGRPASSRVSFIGGGGSRRCIYAPSTLDQARRVYGKHTVQTAMRGALFGRILLQLHVAAHILLGVTEAYAVSAQSSSSERAHDVATDSRCGPVIHCIQSAGQAAVCAWQGAPDRTVDHAQAC